MKKWFNVVSKLCTLKVYPGGRGREEGGREKRVRKKKGRRRRGGEGGWGEGESVVGWLKCFLHSNNSCTTTILA